MARPVQVYPRARVGAYKGARPCRNRLPVVGRCRPQARNRRHRVYLTVQSVRPLNLLAQRRNLLVEPGDLGLRYRFPLTVGAGELREIPGDPLVNLRQTALHLGLSEVPIPRVNGLELAAVNRSAAFAEQFKTAA